MSVRINATGIALIKFSQTVDETTALQWFSGSDTKNDFGGQESHFALRKKQRGMDGKVLSMIECETLSRVSRVS